MEIYGTEGILTLPDPNNFGGWGNDVFLTRVGNAVNGKNEVFRVPFTHGFGDTDPSIPTLSGKREPCYNSWRGLAVVDMAYAIRRGRPHRSSADLALHTVEIIDAIERSMQDNKVYTLSSCPERPAPLTPRLLRRQHRRGFDRQHSLIHIFKGQTETACPFSFSPFFCYSIT